MGIPFPNGTGFFPITPNMSVNSLSDEFARRLNASSKIAMTNRFAHMGLVQTFSNCQAYRMGEQTKKCVFPFVYHGVIQTGCINQDDSQYWCPTEVSTSSPPPILL